MARTHYVKSRRVGKKGEYTLSCQACGKPIEYGTPYKYFTMKLSYGGVKKSYHESCSIPASHRTTSRMGEIDDAQDALAIPTGEPEDDCSTLQSLAEEFAQTVREVSEGYAESASNIEDGFGHSTYQSEELQERADQLESWADDLESIDFEEFDEAQAREDVEDEVRIATSEEDRDPEEDEAAVEAAIEEAIEEKKIEWWDEQCDKLQSAIDERPI